MDKDTFYNKSDVYFEVLKNEPEEYYREFVKFVTHYLNRGNILDLGCGAGQSSYYLAQAGFNVIGFDFSSRFINYAKEKYKDINFRQGDVEKNDLPDNNFDAVVAYNTLEHFTNPEKSLIEMARVIKVGGKIIIQSPNLLSPKLPLSAIKKGGMTFEGKKFFLRLILMALLNTAKLLSKSILKKGKIEPREPNYNYNFPDNDAANYANPVDLKIILEKLGLKIISYQKFNHLFESKNIWQKISAKFFPGAMGIIRIVARKRSIKIAFVNITKTGDIIPPLGALSVASYLLENKEVEANNIIFLDANLHDIKRELLNLRPDIVFISAMTISYNEAIDLAEWAKRKNLKAQMLIGGVHISTAPLSLHKAFSLGVIGEGEITALELLRLYKKVGNFNKKELKLINGLAFYEEGQVCLTDARPLLDNLNNLPALRWDLLSDKYFSEEGIIIDNEFRIVKVGHIMTSRGCPYRCVFCSTSAYWQKFRQFPVKRSVEEIERLHKNYGITIINIWDDMFAVSKDRLRQFKDILKEKNLLGKIKFNIQARSNVIDEEMCGLFKDLGIYSVGLGFESGSERILSYLKRNNFSPEDHKKAVRLLDKYDIYISGSFMLGNPGESREDLEKTIDFIDWISKIKNVYRIWYGLTTPYPGTKLWNLSYSDIDYKNFNWQKLDILHTRFSARVPETFFKLKANRKEFVHFWQEAGKIVSRLEKANRNKMPEAYRLFDQYENKYIVNRFKNFSLKQKIMKTFYRPDKAIKVALTFLQSKFLKKYE